MNVGILAFQGNVAEHRDVLQQLHVEILEVRSVQDLEKVSHLIIPGGESTVIAQFLESSGVGTLIKERFAKGDLALFGTCAGAILLAKSASGRHAPHTLCLIDMDIHRNAYGSQVDSFETVLNVQGLQDLLRVSFIRAPQITRVGDSCTILASHKDLPVIVQSGRVIVSTCHPELRNDPSLHRHFLTL